MKTQSEHYFGGCPECGDTDGYTNVGRGHWFYCNSHRAKWCIGSNLFSSWKDETEAEQRRHFYEIGMDTFERVEPMPWRPTIRERFQTWWRTRARRRPRMADTSNFDEIPF